MGWKAGPCSTAQVIRSKTLKPCEWAGIARRFDFQTYKSNRFKCLGNRRFPVSQSSRVKSAWVVLWSVVRKRLPVDWNLALRTGSVGLFLLFVGAYLSGRA